MSEQPSVFRPESNIHQQQMTLGQKLKSLVSDNDLKSPTVNSSIFQSGCPSFDFLQGEQLNLDNQSFSNCYQPIQSKQVSSNCGNNVPIQSSQKNDAKQYGDLENSLRRKFWRKSTPRIIKSSGNSLNRFQQRILEEKYLEQESVSQAIEGNTFTLVNVVWEIVVITAIITLLAWLPLQIGFSFLNAANQFATFPAIIIFIDIVISVWKKISSYRKSEDVEVGIKQRVCHRDIFYNYYSFIPFIDVLHLISYLMIQLNNNNSNVVLIIIVLVLYLFLGLKQLEIKLDQWSTYFSFDPQIYLFIFKILLSIHYCSCIWHLIGIIEADSWMSELEIRDSDTYTRYCYSFFWSTSNLLHLGSDNLKTMSKIELIYSSLIMFISCWIFSYIIFYTFSHQMGNEDNASQLSNYVVQMSYLNNEIYLQPRKVRQENISNLLAVRTLVIIQQLIQQQQNIISKISPNLKEELLHDMRTQALKGCQILSKFSGNTLKNLIQQMEYTFIEDQQIVDIASFPLYIIEEGKIEVKEYGKTVQSLQGGDYFGQYSFFSGNTIKGYFISTHKTYLYKISQSNFLSIIKQNPADYEMYMFIKHSIQQGDYSVINMNCYFCNSMNHQIQDCPSINSKPKIVNLIKRENYRLQERVKLTRNNLQGYRLNNQTFRRLIINSSSLINFRIKQGIIDSDNDSLEESISNTNHLNSRTVESKQQSISQLINILQYTQEKQCSLQHQQQKIQQQPFEFTAKSTSDPQLEQSQQQILSEGLIHQIDQIKVNISKEGKPNKPANSNLQQKANKNSSQLREEDLYNQNITKVICAEDQYNIPQKRSRKDSSISSPTNNLFIFDSAKQISTINPLPFEKSHKQQDFNNIHFPTKIELIDISRFNNCDCLSLFERMYHFDIYFPLGNAEIIVKDYQQYLSQHLCNQLKKQFWIFGKSSKNYKGQQ